MDGERQRHDRRSAAGRERWTTLTPCQRGHIPFAANSDVLPRAGTGALLQVSRLEVGLGLLICLLGKALEIRAGLRDLGRLRQRENRRYGLQKQDSHRTRAHIDDFWMMLLNWGGVKRELDLNAEKRITLLKRHKCNTGSSGQRRTEKREGKEDEEGERARVALRAGEKTACNYSATPAICIRRLRWAGWLNEIPSMRTEPRGNSRVQMPRLLVCICYALA
jgi:hypothetical protein